MKQSTVILSHNKSGLEIGLALHGKKFDLGTFNSLSCSGQVAALLDIPLSSLLKCYNGIQINSNKFVVNHSVLLCPLQGAISSEIGLLKQNLITETNSVYFICELLRSLKA